MQFERREVKVCPVCLHTIGVDYNEVDEKEAIERLEVYFSHHILYCRREPCKESSAFSVINADTK